MIWYTYFNWGKVQDILKSYPLQEHSLRDRKRLTACGTACQQGLEVLSVLPGGTPCYYWRWGEGGSLCPV